MSRNTKIFLAVFTVFLVIVTALAIIYKNSNKDSNNESRIIIESGQKVPEFSSADLNAQNAATKGIDLDDVYSVNSLTYKYDEYEENDIEVQSVQISGLSNIEIQKNINTDIKERIKKILDSNTFKKNSDNTANVKTSIEANFSDILSIKISVKFSESFTKCYGLNYRLDNGERLKINDLFVFNAPKKNIITESAYRSFAMKYYTDEGISNDFYTNIEGEVLSFLLDYSDNKITEFSFNPFTIELYRDGKTVVIDMLDYYSYISIYTIFKSSTNLYEKVDDNIAKNIPVFTVRPTDLLYDLYEKVNNSCILDVVIYTDEKLSSTEKKVVEKYKKDLVKRLSVVKSEKNVYYSNYIKVIKDREDDNDILVFEENECFAVSEEGKFLETIYNKILSAERNKDNISFGRSKIYFLDEELLEQNVGIKKYDIETGEEVIEREEPEDEDDIEEDEDDIEDLEENTTDENTIDNSVQENSGTENPEEYVGNDIDNLPAANITTQVIF